MLPTIIFGEYNIDYIDIYNVSTLTLQIPKYEENDWLHMNSAQCREKLTCWKKNVLQYFPKGDLNDRNVAFEVMGWLGNESLDISFDERLDFVANIMREYKEKRDRGEMKTINKQDVNVDL